ncbi:MAG: discoidin domain-containing protein, partial [Pirellulales bacterium]|nr:discoidin domain-containing protein [Pirellulales bacterium]
MKKQPCQRRFYNDSKLFHAASILFPVMLATMILVSQTAAGQEPDTLKQSFVTPPDSAKPWVYWFWMNGNITTEGITADLEAMHRAGIGGVTIMHVGAGIPPGPVKFFSDEWRKLFKFAVEEAHRLGIKMSMSACDGWTGTGGPWIRPEEAMMKLVWTETSLQGPSRHAAVLPQPETNLDVYRDVAVLAFPTPPEDVADEQAPRPKVTSSDSECIGKNLVDGDLNTTATIKHTSAKKPAWVQFEFAEPRTVRGVRFVVESTTKVPRARSAWIQAAEDGKPFRIVGQVSFYKKTNNPSYTIAIDETTARRFRVVLPSLSVFREVHLLEEGRVNNWQLKAGFGRYWGHGADQVFFSERQAGPDKTTNSRDPSWTARIDRFAVDRDRVCDITKQMGSTGKLNWKVPDGRWTVLRIGYTPTGEKNGPASIEGTGLEPDALSPKGIDVAFDNFLAKLLSDAGPHRGETLRYCHLDSWETGEQNWTARFPEEFRRRRGYDLTSLLPVMAGGRVVGNLDISERFLWDVRRTIADMLADYYYGRMREVCHQHGVLFQTEAAGAQQFLFDPITYQQQGDLPMGEFWVDEGRIRPDCKAAASVAHIFDKKIVGAESFTAGWKG